MDTALLTDDQLYALGRNAKLTGELREAVRKEMSARNFSIEQLDRMGMEYERATAVPGNSGLWLIEKLLIIALPFFATIQILIASRHLWSGNMKRWKQHIRFMTIGYAIWIVVVMLYARYVLFR